MRRLIPILALLAAGALPAVAQAHQGQTPHLSCGEIDGYFTGFPGGPQTVVLHTAVDGVAQPDQSITANGPNFNTSTGYTNPDGGSHVLTAYFSWTTSEGSGKTPVATTTITNCPPPSSTNTALVQQIQSQQDQINRLQQQAQSNPSSGNAPSTSGGGTSPADLSAVVCTSQRIYRFLTRTKLEGSAVVGIDRVLVRGSERFGSYSKVTRRGRQRYMIRADYRGLVVPKGQLRTVTTFLKLADGRTVRTVQFLRLCLENDGNPNDTPTQDRANR